MSETVTVSYKHYMELSALEGKINLLKDALEKTDFLALAAISNTDSIMTEEIIAQHDTNEQLLRSDEAW